MAKEPQARKLIAQNKKAYHEYFVEEKVEAGIVLHGSEVKSLRLGRATIGEAHAGEMSGELYLFNSYIPEYGGANRFNHETRRPRKLLLKKREVGKLMGAVQRKGYTIVPLQLYFSDKGWAKVEIGLARGKQLHDKRASEKEKDWNREKQRLLRHQS